MPKIGAAKKIVSSMSASYTFLGLMKAVLGASPTTSLVFVFLLFSYFFSVLFGVLKCINHNKTIAKTMIVIKNHKI